METSITSDTATVQGRWVLTRHTAFGAVLVGTLGALAGFLCARLLWM